MWWEILPSGAIIFACSCLPSISAYFINRISCGTPYERPRYSHLDVYMLLRDTRISGVGNPYVLKGLENLDDICAEPAKVEEKCECP